MNYKKQISKLKKELKKYENTLEYARKACVHCAATAIRRGTENRQLRAGFKSILVQIVLTYGRAVVDPDTGKEIGKRLTVPFFHVDECLQSYELHFCADSLTETHSVSVCPRQKKESA